MTNMNRRHLLAGAVAVPLLPAAVVADVPIGNVSADRVPGEIEWPAVRERIAYAGDVLEIPPAEVRAVLALTDSELADQALIAFGTEHGISLDWLVGGEIAPMMRSLAARRTAHRHDPAVAAYHAWLGAHGAYRRHLATHDDWDGPEHDALDEADDKAAQTLADAVPTTAEGAHAKVHFLLTLCGFADNADQDHLDPSTFASTNWTDERENRCARSLMQGLRRMQA